MFYRTLTIVLVAVVVGGMSLLGPASAQEAPKPVPAPETPPPIVDAPADAIKAYIKFIQATPVYKLARAMPEDKLATEIAAWETSFGVEITPLTENFLLRALRLELDGVPAGVTRYWISTDTPGLKTLFFLHVGDGNGNETQYKLDIKSLAELSFTYVEGLRVEHPCARVLPSFSAANASLTEIVSKLAAECGADFTVRSDAADAIKLTLKLKNRTITQCLCEAAAAAGWMVDVPTLRLNTTNREKDVTYAQYQALSATVSGDTITERFENRDYLNLTGQQPMRIETELDALASLVKECADDIKGNNRIFLCPRPENLVISNLRQ